MMKRIVSTHTCTCFIFLVVLLTGCRGTTPPVNFFALNAAYPKDSMAEGIAKSNELTIGLGPLVLPEYLDRSQIVTRKGLNQLEVNEFHRWAGTLEGEFFRVLTENLSALTGTDRIEIYPFRGHFEPEFIIGLKVFAFEGSLGESARLHCVWTLSGPGDSVAETFSTLIVESAPGGFESMVSAKSKALGQLSSQIAKEIKKGR
jgi:uncharacterized lipoprotein YmbA